ncbi:MAG: hybrid sensor histidine kinase/response regulator [Sulfurospirillaceae bacterium]|nr:hybrid sensor histidine kinase/response regulator [Sulfurospirillaceae bacterium]
MQKKQTILVVDDTEINVDILISILKQYDVIPALNGQDALDIVKNEPIDLILLDIMMPDMDGYEVCQKLKTDENSKNIPIIFITVKTSEDDIKKGFEYGAVDYVTKPFNPVELLARVKTHLELQNYQHHLEQRVEEEIQRNRLQDQMLHQHAKQASIGEMLMHIAHQWKQPLSELGSINLSLLGKLEQGTPLEPKALYHTCEQVEQIIKFMSDTILTFQDFYKPITQDSFFSVDDVIHQASNIVSATYDYHNITLEICKEKTPKAYGNANEYAQIILNLLTNAKDAHITNKTKNPKVVITISQADDRSLVSITDNAGGINNAIREDLFKPFHSSTKNSGIGLYMSKIIAEKNHGSITLEPFEDGTKCMVVM